MEKQRQPMDTYWNIPEDSDIDPAFDCRFILSSNRFSTMICQMSSSITILFIAVLEFCVVPEQSKTFNEKQLRAKVTPGITHHPAHSAHLPLQWGTKEGEDGQRVLDTPDRDRGLSAPALTQPKVDRPHTGVENGVRPKEAGLPVTLKL